MRMSISLHCQTCVIGPAAVGKRNMYLRDLEVIKAIEGYFYRVAFSGLNYIQFYRLEFTLFVLSKASVLGTTLCAQR